MIPVSKVALSEAEKTAVMRVLDSGLLAQGKEVEELERQFRGATSSPNAVAFSNGTSALHGALHCLGIKPGDEVITVPFTFIATPNSIRMCGAKPVFVDVGDDFLMNPALVEQAITSKTKAILPVHLYGQPCDMDALRSIAERHKLVIVEDAAQAIGAAYRKKPVGSLGDAAAFSLYATKNIMSGEGGMVTTPRADVADWCRRFRSHGQRNRYEYSELGYNYRMTDMQAAIGVEQIKRLAEITEARQTNARALLKGLAGIKGILLPSVHEGRTHVFHQFTIRVTPDFHLSRDALQQKLLEQGIGTGVYYPQALHLSPAFRELGYHTGDFPVSERLSREVLSLPCHPHLTSAEIQTIIEAFHHV
ncbi:MAG: DegT/DnrJ/EryC1/StrS family aminotransferase [Nanoarchaeota archaeon]|nr:DegT/DnrJ/EryC1/StrS family aminotransferase [Nanoarchaeota archaeon]